MKPQIIIPASLLTLSLFLSGNNGFAARKEQKEIKTEKSGFKVKPVHDDTKETGKNAAEQKKNRPSKPAPKQHQKDSVPFNESHKTAHGEEDGKHHHFHMHRTKRVKRHCNLVCFLAKLLLVISHICLLVSVFMVSFAH
jgi:uncharacterized membrane protein